MNEPRNFLINKKQKLQEDLYKRISEFEQETGLSAIEINLKRDHESGVELKIEDVSITIQLVS